MSRFGMRLDAHLDPLAVDDHGLHRKIDADGASVTLDERTRPEALHQAGLARAAVADQHNLEQIVEALVARVHHQIVGIAAGHSRWMRDDGDQGRASIRAVVLSVYACNDRFTCLLELSFT